MNKTSNKKTRNLLTIVLSLTLAFASLPIIAQAAELPDLDGREVVVVTENAYPEMFKLVGNAMGSEDFGFIFPKGSDLVSPINAGIANLKEDGTLDKLDTVWFLDYKLGQ